MTKMKRSVFFTVFSLSTVLLFSCNKEENVSVNELEGKWELSASIDGYTGQMEELDPGNGKIVEFGTKDYRFIEDNKIIKQGEYTIERKLSKLTNREESYIIYDGAKDGIPQTYTIQEDELTLSIHAMDGPASIYRKLK